MAGRNGLSGSPNWLAGLDSSWGRTTGRYGRSLSDWGRRLCSRGGSRLAGSEGWERLLLLLLLLLLLESWLSGQRSRSNGLV